MISPGNVTINLEPGECAADYDDLLWALNAQNCSLLVDGSTEVSLEKGMTHTGIDLTWENNGMMTIEVEVIEHPTGSNVVACNNVVQISLDESCEIPVEADLILEGDDYGCYEDFEIRLLHVEADTLIEDMLIKGPGTYGVTVTNDDPSKNSCWGTIVAEDKLVPELYCKDQVLSCLNSNFPGDPLLRRYKYEDLELEMGSTDKGLPYRDCQNNSI